jgi:hypothetical protein
MNTNIDANLASLRQKIACDNKKKCSPLLETYDILIKLVDQYKNFRSNFNEYIKKKSDLSIELNSFEANGEVSIYLQNNTNNGTLFFNIMVIRYYLHKLYRNLNQKIYNIDNNEVNFIITWYKKITTILQPLYTDLNLSTDANIFDVLNEQLAPALDPPSSGGKKQKTRRMKKQLRKTRRSKSFRKK